MTVLDAVLNPTAEPITAPPDTGRLSTAQVLITVEQLGAALERAATAFQKIPSSTTNGLDANLEEVITSAKSMQAKAERLKAANR